jgi:uncharacterized protein YwgA/O-acetyl-ADP-ribose deacetylase (regulator of RNase III)
LISVKVGDIFQSEAQTLVNTVNCVGVMGKGLALLFKERFPDMYEDYVRRCEANEVKLGEPYVFRRLMTPWILNFPTKDHWRSVSRLSDIIAGLEHLQKNYQEWGITSLAVPALGCSNGQLEWKVVGRTLYRYLSHFNVPVELYAPLGTPSEEIEIDFLALEPSRQNEYAPINGGRLSRINPAWVGLVEVLERINREPYRAPVGRTSFQKIAYFATELGLPTGLRYARGSYGPFAAELKPLLTKLVNNGLLTEERQGQMFTMFPGPTFDDAKRTLKSQLGQWEEIIDRVTDLMLRIRNTGEAEIAATVFFAARGLSGVGESKPSELDVLNEVKNWKQKRRPPLQEELVAQAIRNLNLLGWIDVAPSNDLPVSEESFVEA